MRKILETSAHLLPEALVPPSALKSWAVLGPKYFNKLRLKLIKNFTDYGILLWLKPCVGGK